MRGVRLTSKEVQYIQFKVPRKSGGFSRELFPDWKTGTPAHDFDSYWEGKNLLPLREEVLPASSKTGEKKANFMNKLTGAPEEAPKPVKEASLNPEAEAEFKSQLISK